MDEKVVEVDEDLGQSLKKAEADLQSQKNALGDKELETMLKIAGLIKDKLPKKEDKVDEDSEEITNTGREEELSDIDRDGVTLDMVKPAIEKMLSSYEADASEWNNTYNELEKEVRAKGVTDPRQIQVDVFNICLLYTSEAADE